MESTVRMNCERNDYSQTLWVRGSSANCSYFLVTVSVVIMKLLSTCTLYTWHNCTENPWIRNNVLCWAIISELRSAQSAPILIYILSVLSTDSHWIGLWVMNKSNNLLVLMWKYAIMAKFRMYFTWMQVHICFPYLDRRLLLLLRQPYQVEQVEQAEEV